MKMEIIRWPQFSVIGHHIDLGLRFEDYERRIRPFMRIVQDDMQEVICADRKI